MTDDGGSSNFAMGDDGGGSAFGAADDGGANLHNEEDEYTITRRQISERVAHTILVISEEHDTDFKGEQGGEILYSVDNDKDHVALTQQEKQLLLSPSAKNIMSEDDIARFLSVWNKRIVAHKDKVSEMLAAKLQKEVSIFTPLQKKHIDLYKQSTVLIDMLHQTISRLGQNTGDLIPYLRQLGVIHANFSIGPKLLAAMKNLILDLMKDVLSFEFTDDVRRSCNNVLSFMVKMMMDTESQRELSVCSVSSVSGHGEQIDASITSNVVKDCQSTWKVIESTVDVAVRLFYDTLIASNAEIADLFIKTDLTAQALQMVRSIGSCIMLLNNLDALIPSLHELGRRHIYYGVKPKYFEIMKKCWFQTLEKALPLRWNCNIRNSWEIAWDFIVYHMCTALEEALLLYVPLQPTRVNLRVLVNHIEPYVVNQKVPSFYADIWYAAYTGANSSQSHAFGRRQNKKNRYENTEALPFGDIRFLNEMKTTEKYRATGQEYIRYFEGDDTWFVRGHITGTFSQRFDLRSYPFDSHQLVLLLSLAVDDCCAMFNDKQLSVKLVHYKLDSIGGCNFDVHEPRISLVQNDAIRGLRKYTHCKVVIPVTRKYIHYVYNVMVPLLGVQLVGFCIYFTDLFPITARLILSVTLLLTLFAFRRSLNNALPPTPYLTLLDHAFNSACFLSIYHIVGLCGVNQLTHLGIEMCAFVNRVVAACGFALFFVIHCVLYAQAKHFVSLHPAKQTKMHHD